MFGNYNVFSIFSQIRFRSNYFVSDNDIIPTSGNSLSAVNTPSAPDNSIAEKPVPAPETAPTDTIELSNTNPELPKTTTPVTYAPTPEATKSATTEPVPADTVQPAE